MTKNIFLKEKKTECKEEVLNFRDIIISQTAEEQLREQLKRHEVNRIFNYDGESVKIEKSTKHLSESDIEPCNYLDFVDTLDKMGWAICDEITVERKGSKEPYTGFELCKHELNHPAVSVEELKSELEKFFGKDNCRFMMRGHSYSPETRRLLVVVREDIFNYGFDQYELDFNESSEELFYVVRKGGYVSSKKTAIGPMSREEAKAKASRMRKLLSPGEKSYYKMSYIVMPASKIEGREEYRIDESSDKEEPSIDEKELRNYLIDLFKNDDRCVSKDFYKAKVNEVVERDKGFVFTNNGFLDLEKKGFSGYGVWVGFTHGRNNRFLLKKLPEFVKDVVSAIRRWLKDSNIDFVDILCENKVSTTDMYRITVVTEKALKESKIEKIFRLRESNSMKELVRDYYMKKYPDDDLGVEINPLINFYDVFDALDSYKDIDDVLQVEDSVIRERVFTRLAELIDCDYDYIYDQWLKCADMKESVQGRIDESQDLSYVMNSSDMKDYGIYDSISKGFSEKVASVVGKWLDSSNYGKNGYYMMFEDPTQPVICSMEDFGEIQIDTENGYFYSPSSNSRMTARYLNAVLDKIVSTPHGVLLKNTRGTTILRSSDDTFDDETDEFNESIEYPDFVEHGIIEDGYEMDLSDYEITDSDGNSFYLFDNSGSEIIVDLEYSYDTLEYYISDGYSATLGKNNTICYGTIYCGSYIEHIGDVTEDRKGIYVYTADSANEEDTEHTTEGVLTICRDGGLMFRIDK